MKIMLINPPNYSTVTLGKFKNFLPPLPPVGLAYLAAYVREGGHDIQVIDAFGEQLVFQEIENRIKKFQPSLIGITCMTPNAPMAQQVASEIKKAFPEITIVFGGIHPSLMPDEVLKDPHVDYIIRKEGEISFLNLINTLESGNPLKDVKGLSWRQEGENVHNEDEKFCENIDMFPFPAWDIFPTHIYTVPVQWSYAHPVLPMLTSRGCPNRCSFCSLQTVGPNYRGRSTENILAELEFLIKNFGVRQIMLLDAIFPINKKAAMEFLTALIQNGFHKKVCWVTETRVDYVDYEVLCKMKEANFRLVAFGIESGVQEILDNVNKNIKVPQIHKAVSLAKKAKLDIYGLYMLGLPGETIKEARETVRLAKELNTDYAKFNITVPYPGTKLFYEAIKEGTLKSLVWSDYASYHSATGKDPVYVPKGMRKDELIMLQKTATREYYLRPKIILSHLFKINSWENLKQKFMIAKTLFLNY